ncbi:MAG: hypothetical protein ACE5G0_07630 [Rhodothermales bacterium]
MDPLSILGGFTFGAGTYYLAQRLVAGCSSREGLGDLLGWAFLVGEGIILMKDGAFLTGLRIRGRDLDSATAAEVNQAAAVIAQVLGLLGEGYSFEINLHRRETHDYPALDRNHYPTPALWALERERLDQYRRQGQHFITENVILITYIPPKETTQRWERLVVEGAGEHLDWTQILHRFKSTVAETESLLATTFFVERLDSRALLTECHRCLTSLQHNVSPPPFAHSYLSYVLASDDFMTGFQPVVGRRYVFAISITSLGMESVAASSDWFNRLRENARWHLRFVCLSRHEADRRISKLQTRWFHQRGGLRALFTPGDYQAHREDFENLDATEMQRETSQALADNRSGRARFGYLTSTILLHDTDRDRGAGRALALMQAIRDQGWTCSLETINATDAFLGSLPGHGSYNLRRPLLSSVNLAHLFPTTTPWPGEAVCPSNLFPSESPPLLYARTGGATPFRVNLHQGDVGHTLVVGATGAGKSVLVGMLAMSWLRYAESRVFIFDVGYSHLIPTLAAAGMHYDLAGEDGSIALQPLRYIDEDAERIWALFWLETVCELCGHSLSPDDRRELGHALDLLAQAPPQGRTLTALYVSLPRRLQDVLEPYTVKGTFGRLLDAHDDGTRPERGRVHTFELSEVIQFRDRLVVPLLMHLFRRIERSLDGTPTLIVIEEAWAALMRSAFAQRVQQWLLTLRKRNAAVVLVTHSPAQIRELPNAAMLTESCPTKIILPNPEARHPDQAEVYRTLGLNAREIEIIATATRKRDYYYKSTSGSRLFDLNLGQVALTLLTPLPGLTVQESTTALQTLIAQHGEAFLDHIDEASLAEAAA